LLGVSGNVPGIPTVSPALTHERSSLARAKVEDGTVSEDFIGDVPGVPASSLSPHCPSEAPAMRLAQGRRWQLKHTAQRA